MFKNEKIMIIDFGSQYTQLIARRVRELGVYSEIVPPQQKIDDQTSKLIRGVIISGSPLSANNEKIDFGFKLFKLEIPILGICFGMQLIATYHSSKLSKGNKREYGKHEITIDDLKHPLFSSLNKKETVWMSHQDTVEELSDEFKVLARSNGIISAIGHKKKPIFGIQFHPEVTHTEKGTVVLKNFLEIADCKKNWNLDDYISDQCKKIHQKVNGRKVISLISGGIDSLVATLLCVKALGADKVYPVHIDSNLMRYKESNQILKTLCKLGFENVSFINAKNKFINALKNISKPEEKRKIIGDLFIQLLDEKINELNLTDNTLICQGTLYTDLIESGKGMADVIKSHHNVSCKNIEKKKKLGLILEPNALIFKDEVRKIAKQLSVPDDIINRHPFPGPGLAIRILGEVDEEKILVLQKVDRILIEELKNFKLYEKVWQTFCVLIPMKSVAVIGDKRSYGYIVAIRSVDSIDGMTADFSKIPFSFLSHISTKIINEVVEVTRVVYDITSKPPATIEWE